MIFEDYYTLSEIHQWRIESDIAWDEIDKKKAKSQPELLDQLRDACIIESYHPIGTVNLMQLLAENVEATAILSVELYEGFKHFYVLKRYLETIGYEKSPSITELSRLRKRALKAVSARKSDLTQELIDFIFTEHFASYYFIRIAQKAKDPILKSIATFIARDEFRHTQAAYDILKARLEAFPDQTSAVLEAAYNFRHYGHNIVEEVPVFQRNDMQAINTFLKKIEALTGCRLVDHAKPKLAKK